MCSLLSIIVCVKVKPLASIAFTAWSVMRPTSLVNSWLLVVSAASSTLDFSSRMRVISAERWLDRGGDLVGLADEVARDLGADAEQRALDVAGVLLEHVADAGRHARQAALGVVGAGADRRGGVGGELRERPLGLAGVGLDRLVELLEARRQHRRRRRRQVADRAFGVVGVRLDGVRHLLDAAVDRLDRGRWSAARASAPRRRCACGWSATAAPCARSAARRRPGCGPRSPWSPSRRGRAAAPRSGRCGCRGCRRLPCARVPSAWSMSSILSPMFSASLAPRTLMTPVTSAMRLSSAATTSLPPSASVLAMSMTRAPSASLSVCGAAVERLLEAHELLVEAGGDLGRLGGDPGVEIVEVVVHRARDFLGALAQTLDHLAAVGLHRAVEFGEVAGDQIAERGGVAGDASRRARCRRG